MKSFKCPASTLKIKQSIWGFGSSLVWLKSRFWDGSPFQILSLSWVIDVSVFCYIIENCEIPQVLSEHPKHQAINLRFWQQFGMVKISILRRVPFSHFVFELIYRSFSLLLYNSRELRNPSSAQLAPWTSSNKSEVLAAVLYGKNLDFQTGPLFRFCLWAELLTFQSFAI